MSASPADTLELMANMLHQPLTDAERGLMQQRLRQVAAECRRVEQSRDDVVMGAYQADAVRRGRTTLRVVL